MTPGLAERVVDPAVEGLFLRLRDVVTNAVDTLHVAAVLESSGVTDDVARDRYGHVDVFALATTLRARATGTTGRMTHPGVRPPTVRRRSSRRPAQDTGTLGHGLIYLLPALCMPALLQLVTIRYAATALVVGASVGWLWAVVATWRAFGVLSSQGRTVAEGYLRRAVVVGVAAGVGAGAVLVLLARTPVVVGVTAAAVTAAQLGTTLLFFLRRKHLLVLVLVLQGAVGLGNLLAPSVVPAWVVLGVFVVATGVLLLAGGVVGRHGGDVPPLRTASGLVPVAGYAVGSVAFLLIPQAGFLHLGGGVPLALAGLFLTMGFVEWRGGAVSVRLRTELSETDTPARFRRRSARILLVEAVACCSVTALGTVLVLLAIDRLGLLSTGVLVTASAATVLAGAYLMTLALANGGAYAWLGGCFSAAALLESSLWSAGAPVFIAFVTAAGALFAVLTVGLLGRPVNRFR